MCGTVTDQPPPAPEHVDDPWDGVDIDNAVASFFRALADGPLRDDALLAALRDDGAWGALGELADDDFAAEISDLDVPGLWRTQMAMWFDVFRTLDGRVFTHRVTADELAEGAVAALPDFTLVDWDVPARRIVGGSGAVATDFDPAFDRFDGGRLVGPDGWLDGFAPGDVLGVRLVRDDTVRVERIDAADLPGPDDPAVAELATAFRPCFDRWSNGNGDELAPAVLDVLADVPDAFRTPTLPLGELAVSAGLERRGLEFGPADRPWLTHAQQAFRRRGDELAADLVDWLASPLRTVVGVMVEWLGDADALPASSVAKARDALATEGVAGMAGELFRGHTAPGRLARFVEALGGPGNDAATPSIHVLVGIAAELGGRFDDAEQEFRAALDVDPGQLDAVVELGILASDRGDAVEAERRFRSASGPEAWLRALSGLLPPRATGRNEPCPCGSGRKFKQCCLVNPTTPVERRGPWYELRLARHLANRDALAFEIFYGVLSEYLHEEAEINDALVDDLVSLATGNVGSYLDAHADRLSDVDRAGLEAWRDAPVTLHHDPESGVTARRVVPLGAAEYVVWSLPLDETAAEELEGLLGDDDAVTSVVEWALWYVSTFEED